MGLKLKNCHSISEANESWAMTSLRSTSWQLDDTGDIRFQYKEVDVFRLTTMNIFLFLVPLAGILPTAFLRNGKACCSPSQLLNAYTPHCRILDIIYKHSIFLGVLISFGHQLPLRTSLIVSWILGHKPQNNDDVETKEMTRYVSLR